MQVDSAVLPDPVLKNDQNYYEDPFSQMARCVPQYHLFGPWLIARAAAFEGAEVVWLNRQMILIQHNGVQLFFWDVRSNESAVGAKLATHKGYTHSFLKRAAVSTPSARQVMDAESAVRFWKVLGKPVVVKPLRGTRGRAVALNLNDESSINIAFHQARSSVGALVEEQVHGSEYRFFVLGDDVLAVLGKESAHVIGDGISTVEALVEEKNSLRSMNPRLMTSLIPLDEIAFQNLARQGLNWQSVPDAEQHVVLRQEANISKGADTFDATDLVSERAKAVAVAAVKALPGLDWAGVDVMLSDPCNEQGEVYVIEVNTCPGLGGHHFPMRGKPRDVATAVWRRAYEKQKALSSTFSIVPIPAALPARCQRLVSIEGKVQGVGFRKWLRREAVTLNVEGWVRYRQDGTLQAALKGKRSEVEQLLGKLHFGPRTATVAKVSVAPYNRKLSHSGFKVFQTL
ncbi:acylphosphatase [Halomonas sp. AOP5-CZ2-32]